MAQYIDKAAIVAEIERRIKAIPKDETDKRLRAVYGNEAFVLIKLLSFLDALEVKEVDLEEEPVSEDLEKEIHNFALHYHGEIATGEDGIHLLDVNESKLLEIARHFANWQKEQDQKTIELAEDHAMLAGMEKMKEEMLKDAKYVEVFDDWTYGMDADGVKQPAVKLRDQSLQIGSEVKLIIIKKD